MRKPFGNSETKFDIVELLLGGQGKKDFIQSKKTVTKSLVASDRIVTIASLRGIAEDSSKMTLNKFKNQAFKEFVAMHQVNYLWQNLCKPVGKINRACTGRHQDISNYLECFPGPYLNVPITKGDLNNILNQMVPT